jgi:acyl carrier protein phosphodiesterase
MNMAARTNELEALRIQWQHVDAAIKALETVERIRRLYPAAGGPHCHLSSTKAR